LKRTRQSTDEVLHVFPNTPVLYRDDLMEMNSTNYVGRPLEWTRQLGNPYNSEFADRFHYSVELEQHQADRMIGIVREAIESFYNGIICIVSHGDPLAFLVDALHHSGKQTQTIDELKKDIYLLRGEAWRIILDETLRISESERISPTIKDHSQSEH
jgi:broad specificity phosphatase PhoE